MPYRFDGGGHTCELETRRCAHPGGCKRAVTLGLPLCWQHTRLALGLRVAESTIPNAGKGLFALRDFAKDEWICDYGGELMSMAALHARYPGDAVAPYGEQISTNRGTDAACVRGLGSMANGVARKRDANAKTQTRVPGRTPWLRALRRIRAGEEILNHYGPEYFAGDIASTTTYVRRRKSPKRAAAAA